MQQKIGSRACIKRPLIKKEQCNFQHTPPPPSFPLKNRVKGFSKYKAKFRTLWFYTKNVVYRYQIQLKMMSQIFLVLFVPFTFFNHYYLALIVFNPHFVPCCCVRFVFELYCCYWEFNIFDWSSSLLNLFNVLLWH